MLTEADIYEQANMLWPVRIFPYQVVRFLRAFKQGKFCELDLEQAWQKRKLDHIAYWQDRYGLSDARPFSMKSALPIVQASWQPDSLLGLKVNIKMLGQPLLILYLPASQTILQERLSVYAKQYNLQLPSNAISSFPTGHTIVFAEPLPEHDWQVWREAIRLSLEQDGAKVQKRKLSKLIADYKAGNSKATSIAELKELIKEQACIYTSMES